MNDINRMLPNSEESEQGLISSILLDRSIMPAVIDLGVTPEWFYRPAHALIFREISARYGMGLPVGLLELTQHLRDHCFIDECGGVSYLSQLQTFMPTASSFEYLAGIIREKKTLRDIIASGEKMKERAYNDQSDVQEILSEAASSLAQIADPAIRRKRTFKDALHDKLDRMQHNTPDADLILTGIDKLDDASPLRLGDMPLVCGERKAGKSILALTITQNVFTNHRVLYFSLEDPESKIIDRIFAGQSRIPLLKRNVRDLNNGEMGKACTTIEDLQNKARITIRDDVYDLEKILAVAKGHKAEHPDLSMIVVDYAQLVRSDVKKNETREREVAKVSRSMRLLAMELNVALMLLSQLNSDGESRESRALEQDATACWKIETIEDKSKNVEHGKRILHIPWQRNGESGIAFAVTFLGHIARIENHTEESKNDNRYESRSAD